MPDFPQADENPAAATTLIGELVAIASSRSDRDLEDELCVRLGRAMGYADNGPIEEQVDPAAFGEATVEAAVEAAATDPENALRVLAAVARIAPDPLCRTATGAIGDMHAWTSSTVDGAARWIRDLYGGRFGVVAPFLTPDGPDRWYLWDIDTCGHLPVTVHSGYYDGSDQALAAWRDGVGHVASDGSVAAAVDDPALLARLLPGAEGVLRMGGESPEQLAEYLRGRRLAQEVLRTIGAVAPVETDQSAVIMEFLAWLKSQRDGHLTDDFESRAIDIVGGWLLSGTAELPYACSPHRVALFVAHLGDIHGAEVAAEMVRVLPDLISWLAERNGTPPDLAQRCLTHLSGEPYPGTEHAGGRDFMARVAE